MPAVRKKRDAFHAFDEVEGAIRAGKTAEAREALSAVAPSSLDRSEWAPFARLSWRCGAAALGARLLYPVVRGTSKFAVGPSEAERAEYAMCLAKLGAHGEAKDLLRAVSYDKYPRAELYLALAEVGTWDYPASIPSLRRYLDRKGLTDYDRATARLNLAAALGFQKRYWEADGILRRLLHDCSYHRWHLLRGNVCEVYGMSLVWRRRWQKAEAILRQAHSSLRDTEAFDELLVRKGLAALALLKDPEGTEGKREMAALRKEALRRRHWNTLRECDRIVAVASGDHSLATRVAFGTPSDAYRKQIADDTKLEPSPHYSWVLGEGRDSGGVLDAADGSWLPTGESLRAGGVPHRLLIALASDFYRPIRLATLFQRVFPDEVYSPLHAPTRIHQAVRILRSWLRARHPGLGISFRDDGYFLTAKGAVVIRVPWSFAAENRGDWALNRLRTCYATEPFAAREVAKELSLSLRSAQLLLGAAVARGLLTRVGSRRGARYRFV